MQLEVTKYLLVDTLNDFLVIQITTFTGVNVFRSKDRAKAQKQYDDIKASGYYHMLALVSGDATLLASEYKPSPPDTSWAKEVVKPAPREWPQVPKQVAIAEHIEATKPALPPGFGTGLPSGFKTGK